jgi:hypothetical protein
MKEEVHLEIESSPPDQDSQRDDEDAKHKARRLKRFETIHHLVPIVLALICLLLWGVILGLNNYGTNRFESKPPSEESETEVERPYFVDDEQFWNQSTWEP